MKTLRFWVILFYTDAGTHFIVSLGRTYTVAQLRELVKVTHSACYPHSRDVNVWKLAVPGGEYGYDLADFLLIGQVYDRYEGKVFAEVKHHDPASVSFETSSTQKKVPLLAPKAELVPKLQKEEMDDDGFCILGSKEPLDGLPSRARGLAVGSFERIDEEEDAKLVERPSVGAEVRGADLACMQKKRQEDNHLDSQFMIVNNTDHILEHEREDKNLESEAETKGPSGVDEDGSLVSPKKSGKKSKEVKVKSENIETDVVGSPDTNIWLQNNSVSPVHGGDAGHRDPSPELYEKAETSQRDKFKPVPRRKPRKDANPISWTQRM